jgi:hypothetical protein
MTMNTDQIVPTGVDLAVLLRRAQLHKQTVWNSPESG